MNAPGQPGLAPTWSSSDKDIVTTALGRSRLWATLGHGIVNEIYTPSTGEPQIRDLGFIVAREGEWHEVKRVARYTIELPEPWIPLPKVVHTGDDYTLTLEILCDPSRETLLVRYALTGAGMRLYPLLAPHLGPNGHDNSAWVTSDALCASGVEECLCLLSSAAPSRTSAGYVGASDGWQDFARNGRMTWTEREAAHGNVALMAELEASSGVLAIGFARSVEGARTRAASSLADGYDATRERFVAEWRRWGEGLVIPEASEEIRREAYLSATVLKVHEDKSYPGAVVASLSVPWGNSHDDLGGYHLVWARDAVEAGLGLLAAGQVEDARTMLGYLVATQCPDGHWSQNMFPDGRPFWGGVQLDEAGFPVLLAACLEERGDLGTLEGVDVMVHRALGFLARSGPVSPQDRWEENAGSSPFTLAVEVAALVAGADFLPDEEKAYALSLADCWNERIEEWTYADRGERADAAGVEGYYVRIAPPPGEGGLRGRVRVRNRPDEEMAADALVSMDFLYLARLGLRAAGDPRMRDTLKVAEAVLRVDTPNGPSYHRYNDDGYGEHADGAPFDGTGIGRAWPLLCGERGHFALQSGEDALPWLEAMARMSGTGGLIPEQVWDSAPIESRGLRPGAPSGSAMPLVWAHAEFLKLLYARDSGEPIELLESLRRRYGGRRPEAATWHWREDVPFSTLPPERSLLVEARAPFALRVRFDDAGSAEPARHSRPLAFGLHGVRLDARDLASHTAIHFSPPGREPGSDERRVTLQRPQPPAPARSPARPKAQTIA